MCVMADNGDFFFFPLIFILVVNYVYRCGNGWPTFRQFRKTLLLLGVYLMIGIVWSLFKYAVYINRHKNSMEFARCVGQNSTKIQQSACMFDSHENKVRDWIIYWPVSICHSVISDLMLELTQLIMRNMRNSYITIGSYLL